MFVFVGILLSPTVPVIVSVTQRPDRNFKSLPHWIQSILHHFCFVADGIPVRHTPLLTDDRSALKVKANPCVHLSSLLLRGVLC